MFELFLNVLIWLWLEMLLPNIQPKQDLYTIIHILNTLHCAPLKSLSVLSTLFSLKQMFCLVTNESRFVVRLNGLFCAVSAFLTMMVCVCPGVGSLGSSHWEMMGDAMVTTEQVRLTPDMQSRQGAVWSRLVSINKH